MCAFYLNNAIDEKILKNVSKFCIIFKQSFGVYDKNDVIATLAAFKLQLKIFKSNNFLSLQKFYLTKCMSNIHPHHTI